MNETKEIVEHFKCFDKKHMFYVMNKALSIKEDRIAHQLSYFSNNEIVKLMDEIDANRVVVHPKTYGLCNLVVDLSLPILIIGAAYWKLITS